MSGDSSISLVVGLGNPGARYRDTWHNLGFMVLDWWSAQKNLAFKPGRGDYHRLTYNSPASKVIFLKPTPFMNLSGVPVARVAHYLKLSPENVLIVCDDVALPFGTLRIRKSGSDGGHNGLASVIAELGSEDIPRLRIGIWTEGWRGELSDYVLTAIPKSFHQDLRKMIAVAAEAIDCILTRGLGRAMNCYNRDFFQAETAKKTADSSSDDRQS